LNRLSLSGTDFDAGWLVQHILIGAVVGAAVAGLLHLATRKLAERMDPDVRGRFLGYEPWTYLPGLGLLLGAFGLSLPWLVLIALGLVAAKSVALLRSLPPAQRRQASKSQGYLAFLFLISGFAALIYQIVWQRALFTAFGVNIESITIIVSLFMFGLGIGSLIGGLLIRKFPRRAPLLFLICQWGIGGFGFLSLPLIAWVASVALYASQVQMALAVFALLAIPTILMGATLPILVGHLYRFYQNVGRSVGLLYCINTVGSAIACFLTADVLFVLFGLAGAVWTASICNVLVGVLVWRYARALAAGRAEAAPEALASTGSEPAPAPAGGSRRLRNALVAVLAAAVAYISLSQEIVWMRVVSYMTGGRPTVFAHVLGWFLLGVAGGALVAKWACQRNFRSVGGSALGYTAGMLLISGVFYYVSIQAAASLNAWSHTAGLWATQLIVMVVAFLLGGIFPVLCHYAASDGRHVGLTVSRLYVANIIGSTAGPLVTGFVLMDLMTTDQLILSLSVATLLVGAVVLLVSSLRRGLIGLAAAGAIAAGLVGMHDWAYQRFYERLQLWGIQGRFAALIETRSGVISVESHPGGDIVYGGGIYDGRFNLDPVTNSNKIHRCYMVAALHPEPKRVLEIGLSTGSWAMVLAWYEPIEELVIVEINPGYLELIEMYPENAPLLQDPKVAIHIDDGRRWMNRNPDETFDMIVANTTFYWRSHATGLLSREFLELCKSRLNPGGVVYWNTTQSPDVPRTAAAVFKHVVRYGSFVAASDSPFDLPPEKVRANLLQFVRDGRKVFQANPERRALLDALASTQLEDVAESLRSRDDLTVITDDNMHTEYKLVGWYDPAWSWAAMLGRMK
jgi:spermidine synthase